MDLIRKYFPGLTPLQLLRFEKLEKLFFDWNRKINVISRKDILFFYERHLLHSLGIAKVFHFQDHSRIMDVGTGGGLPGIPLAIFYPECFFTLVDSIGKKIMVVRAITEEIGLDNVRSRQVRVENYSEKFHYIVGRAVTDFRKFMNLVSKNIDRDDLKEPANGVIYLKGGDLEEELKPFHKVQVFNMNDFFKEEYFLTKKIIYTPV
jgi:16S rRNA (guanine527-N7)-methyltransferase